MQGDLVLKQGQLEEKFEVENEKHEQQMMLRNLQSELDREKKLKKDLEKGKKSYLKSL